MERWYVTEASDYLGDSMAVFRIKGEQKSNNYFRPSISTERPHNGR